MIINKTYQLVDAKSRLYLDLRDYNKEIRKAAEMSFRELLIDLKISQHNFIISIKSPTSRIKHGVLVNFGKNIARQAASLCATAMKVYPNDKHLPSHQLFNCKKTNIVDK
ncbi:hypothetical protein GJV07_11800 [Enterobacteriaceae bacterium RIT711]|nr:hypothetical protein [Enterobacteriaceae bacterium RIT711]